MHRLNAITKSMTGPVTLYGHFVIFYFIFIPNVRVQIWLQASILMSLLNFNTPINWKICTGPMQWLKHVWTDDALCSFLSFFYFLTLIDHVQIWLHFSCFTCNSPWISRSCKAKINDDTSQFTQGVFIKCSDKIIIYFMVQVTKCIPIIIT